MVGGTCCTHLLPFSLNRDTHVDRASHEEGGDHNGVKQSARVQALKDHLVMEVVSLLSARTAAAREQTLDEITRLAEQYQQRCRA
jgi:hypothetical protein